MSTSTLTLTMSTSILTMSASTATAIAVPSCCLPMRTNCIRVGEQPWSLGKLRGPVLLPAPGPNGRPSELRCGRYFCLLLLLLLQHSSKRSLVSGCQSMQLATSSSTVSVPPAPPKKAPPAVLYGYHTGVTPARRPPPQTPSQYRRGPPSGLAHPSQQVWLSHNHHETPEQSEISRSGGRSIHNNSKGGLSRRRVLLPVCLRGTRRSFDRDRRLAFLLLRNSRSSSCLKHKTGFGYRASYYCLPQLEARRLISRRRTISHGQTAHSQLAGINRWAELPQPYQDVSHPRLADKKAWRSAPMCRTFFSHDYGGLCTPGHYLTTNPGSQVALDLPHRERQMTRLALTDLPCVLQEQSTTSVASTTIV